MRLKTTAAPASISWQVAVQREPLLFLVIPAKAGIQWSAKTLDYSPHPRLALRAIGFADVRYGILPAQSGLRRDDERRV